MTELKTVGSKEIVTRITAIKRFFNMDAKQALAEVKELKNADPIGYDWMGKVCADALNLQIDQNNIG
jgi:hypothetical protein